MPDGDVETIDKQGQWVNRVVGEPERSQSFASRDEAIEAGEALAAELGTSHTVSDAEPEGVITDPDETNDPGEDAIAPTFDDLQNDDPDPVDPARSTPA